MHWKKLTQLAQPCLKVQPKENASPQMKSLSNIFTLTLRAIAKLTKPLMEFIKSVDVWADIEVVSLLHFTPFYNI